MFDTCANSQQLKCLTVIDEHTREALAIDVAGSIRSERVVEVLSRLISERGAPKFLRSDNGPEFVSTRLLQCAADEGLQMALRSPASRGRTVPMRVSTASSRRVPVDGIFSESNKSTRRDRTVAAPLQRSTTALCTGLPDPRAVRRIPVRQGPRSHFSQFIRGPKQRIEAGHSANVAPSSRSCTSTPLDSLGRVENQEMQGDDSLRESASRAPRTGL